jgi:hypothetical protein
MIATMGKLSRPVGIAAWIIFCVFCNCAGWGLSAIHQLNAAGYAAAFGLGIAAVIVFRKDLLPEGLLRPRWGKVRRRFRRFFPASFAVLAAMAILGGLLHRPSNPDGLTQRIPHLLNWLAQERWHWIENAPPSFNSHAVGFEWLMSPMLALLKTDRWIFLYNVISFLLLPGLVFSLFKRLGVTPRAAWYWMWLVPAGYCFTMQVGGIGNDAAGAIFALATVDFALRAKASGNCSDLWLSILAAGLLSTAKMSNLALGLPWLIAVWPSLRLLFRRPVASAIIALTAVVSSALPIMFLIHQHGGGWTGAALQRGRPLAPPFVSVAGNALNLALENLLPPVFPMARWWNEHVYKIFPQGFIGSLERSFESEASHLSAIEIQYEICAGIGVGLTLLLLISWIWARSHRASANGSRSSQTHLALVRWSPLISLLAFMLNVDVSGPARIITPFYCLLMPLALMGRCHQTVVRRRWWQILAAMTLVVSAVLLILNPPRPLWPARTIMNPLSERYPDSSLITRAAMLYNANAERWDALAPIRDKLPAHAKNVGFINFMQGSTMETSLWRPFGQRRIYWLSRSVDQPDLNKKGIKYVVVGTDPFTQKNFPNLHEWMNSFLQANNGRIIAQEKVTISATSPPVPWYLIEVASPNR